jgi:hypothetical protein
MFLQFEAALIIHPTLLSPLVYQCTLYAVRCTLPHLYIIQLYGTLQYVTVRYVT